MFKGSQKAQTYKRRYKRTCTRYHKSQCLWCWEHGLMGLPLEEVIFLYRHCQTWLLSCLRNHSEAQAGFWKGITWHLQNFPRAEHSKGLSCRVVWRTNNSLIAQCCGDGGVLSVLSISHNFCNDHLCLGSSRGIHLLEILSKWRLIYSWILDSAFRACDVCL